MHIRDIVAGDRTTISFEFFPPRSEDAWDALFERISAFEALAPSFVSVTYGAGGSTRDQTHDLVVRLHEESELDPIPHLTCIGHRREDIDAILNRYARAGIGNILVIGGDPPRDDPGYDRSQDACRYAADLIAYIREWRAADGAGDARGFGILAAGFPEGHPATPNRLQEMEHLKAKVDAGVDVLVTQMFFDNNEFYDWRERAQAVGIDVPMVAGIMPVTSLASLRRMADLAAGTRFPAKLLKGIERRQDDPDAVRQFGILWATEQCRDLLDHEVDGIHFYTLNRSDATQQIYRTLGARDSAMLRATP